MKPKSHDYSDLAGISEQSVLDKTGRSWSAWLLELDSRNAQTLPHREIAALVAQGWPEIGPWWAQSVTVGYERIRGLRETGQLSSGDFAASKSKTFHVATAQLWPQLEDPALRSAWTGSLSQVRTATAQRSMRLDWPDGTRVSFWLQDKGPNKCSLSVQHEKLARAEHRDKAKLAWALRLKALEEALSA